MKLLFLPAFACAVCFGDPNSLASRGLWWAVVALSAVVVSVLAAIAWTAFAWARRAKKMEAAS